jgi:hypothetical protein
VRLQHLAIGVVERERRRGPAHVRVMRVLVPLRELIDDLKDLRGAGVGDDERELAERELGRRGVRDRTRARHRDQPALTPPGI